MKLKPFKITGIAVFAMFVVSSYAQNKPRVKTPNNQRKSVYETPQNNQPAADTTGKNNTNPGVKPSAYGAPAGNTANNAAGNAAIDTSKLPIVDVKSGGNGLTDSLKPSLRNDAAIEMNLVKDRAPLEYENIREDDAVFRVRVWREIDVREKMNLPFRYAAVEDNGGQRFISILLNAIKSGQVTAFSGDDDRFTTPIKPEDAFKGFGGGQTLSKHVDSLGNVDYMVRRDRQLEPDSITTFRLKEEWIFDKESSRMFVRILGIAPVIKQQRSDGIYIPGSEHPVFWVYYPDMRPVLSKYDVYNPKNYGARMTWEELFESRMFSSYIIKSTLDNPYDLNIAAMYPNNTLFRLLEGEHIKDKIFDYEQSLWQY